MRYILLLLILALRYLILHIIGIFLVLQSEFSEFSLVEVDIPIDNTALEIETVKFLVGLQEVCDVLHNKYINSGVK